MNDDEIRVNIYITIIVLYKGNHYDENINKVKPQGGIE